MTDRDDDFIGRDEVDRRFVSLDRYLPVERLVYGVIFVLGSALVGIVVKALMAK